MVCDVWASGTRSLCGACAGMLGKGGLGLVVHFPSGYVAKINKYPVTVTVTVYGTQQLENESIHILESPCVLDCPQGKEVSSP